MRQTGASEVLHNIRVQGRENDPSERIALALGDKWKMINLKVVMLVSFSLFKRRRRRRRRRRQENKRDNNKFRALVPSPPPLDVIVVGAVPLNYSGPCLHCLAALSRNATQESAAKLFRSHLRQKTGSNNICLSSSSSRARFFCFNYGCCCNS